MPLKILLYTLAAVILAAILPAAAQLAEAQPGKVYRVGILTSPGKAEERGQIKGLRDGLREAGYIEGKNLQLSIPEVRSYDELRSVAKGYVAKRTDAIVTSSGTATGIAKEATKEIPIIFIWGVSDPVDMGLVKSLARPESNITGLTSEPGAEISGKRLELFKEAIPGLRRVVLLHNARGENLMHAARLTVVRELAPRIGLTLQEKPAKAGGDIDEALRNLSKEPSDGIFIICSGLFNEPFKKIVAVASQKKLPLWNCFPDQTGGQGALISYHPDTYRNGHRGAWYVDKILKGTKPADLPVEQPTKFELVINLRAAKQIGLTIPPNVLVRADKVIK